jgi:hypothetical protein
MKIALHVTRLQDILVKSRLSWSTRLALAVKYSHHSLLRSQDVPERQWGAPRLLKQLCLAIHHHWPVLFIITPTPQVGDVCKE